MTKEEAIKAMQTHRVRHGSWSENFWCSKCTNGIIYLANGTWLTTEEFNEAFSGKLFEEDWEKLPNPERGIG